ncbi:MAG: hypothetical protein CME68_02790 [Halobacteriovoraceae bacterium]|nr:hypothetical protein [Halobacteriovoraceae bacterium]
MKLKFLFILILSLSLFKVQASEIKIPKEATGIKEIEAFRKELKYIKTLKNHYIKKSKILNHLTLEAKSLLKAKKKFLRKKAHYQRNIQKFQNIKNNKVLAEKALRVKSHSKKNNDYITSQYISRVRKLFIKKDIALNCRNRDAKKFPSSSYGGVTASYLTIDSKGRLLNLRIVSPIKNGFHNKNILRCLSKQITHTKFPKPPTDKPLTIMQPFLFSS